MMTTDDEKYRLRKKAAAYLKSPSRRKTKGVLDNGHGGRCCLGHICQALKKDLKIEVRHNRVSVEYDGGLSVLPRSVMYSLGFFDMVGTFLKGDVEFSGRSFVSLVDVNDSSETSPQEIGTWLETVILGGEGTPWSEIKPSEEAMRDE